MSSYDAIIIGAGPAGLSAALVLARCRRRILVFDAGHPRNGAARALHGFLTRDGVSPWELRDLGWADLARYPDVTRRDVEVEDAWREADGFRARTRDGDTAAARVLLLATGREDPLPPIPGCAELYGRGVYHCPYCDGWENRGRAFAVYGGGPASWDLADELLTWSDDVTLCTNDAPPAPRPGDAEASLPVRREPIARLEADARGRLSRLHFADGAPPLSCDAFFFPTECPQRSPLPERLGCRLDDNHSVRCQNHAATGVPGLYVAGNVRCGLHLAITAAAEGAEAAVAMNEELSRQTRRRR